MHITTDDWDEAVQVVSDPHHPKLVEVDYKVGKRLVIHVGTARLTLQELRKGKHA